MDRRSFLTLLGSAAVGGAGLTAASLGLTEEADPAPDLGSAAAPPGGARIGTRRIIWSVETTAPVVAFTFDDGPDSELTPRVLDILDRYGVKATFHVMGYSALRNPDLLVETVRRGHEIGNHTWTHLELVGLTPERIREELELGRQAIQEVTGIPPRFFRPPRGQLNGVATRLAAEMGYDIILWSVGRGTPDGSTSAAVADHLVQSLRPGDIAGLHDGIGRETFNTELEGPGPIRQRREVEIRALPAIIEGALARGLKPTTVSEVLGKSGS